MYAAFNSAPKTIWSSGDVVEKWCMGNSVVICLQPAMFLWAKNDVAYWLLQNTPPFLYALLYAPKNLQINTAYGPIAVWPNIYIQGNGPTAPDQNKAYATWLEMQDKATWHQWQKKKKKSKTSLMAIKTWCCQFFTAKVCTLPALSSLWVAIKQLLDTAACSFASDTGGHIP